MKEAYIYNTNTDLDGEINRFINNNKNFIDKKGHRYKINKTERLILERILKKNKNRLRLIAKNTSKENLQKLQKEKILSGATYYVKSKIEEILRIKDVQKYGKEKKELNTINSKSIEKNSNYILKSLNKTSKGRKFLEYVKKYSPISIEKMSSLISKSSSSFDVPYKYIVAIMIGESDVSRKRNPFSVNRKGVGQFLTQTWKGMYSKIKWKRIRGKRVLDTGSVKFYFKKKGMHKYASALEAINIKSLNDRYNPEKSIMAIGAYLKYISLVGKGVRGNYYNALARYNVGPYGNIGTSRHLKHNPVIYREFKKIYGNKASVTKNRVLYAAKKYYSRFV